MVKATKDAGLTISSFIIYISSSSNCILAIKEVTPENIGLPTVLSRRQMSQSVPRATTRNATGITMRVFSSIDTNFSAFDAGMRIQSEPSFLSVMKP